MVNLSNTDQGQGKGQGAGGCLFVCACVCLCVCLCETPSIDPIVLCVLQINDMGGK